MQKKKHTQNNTSFGALSRQTQSCSCLSKEQLKINFSSSMKQSPDVNWLPTVKTEELWIPKKEER